MASDQFAESSTTRMVAARIRQLRKELGWTAQHLANQCAEVGLPNLSRGTLAKIESGSRGFITVDELSTLAKVLGTSEGFLLGSVATKPWRAVGANEVQLVDEDRIAEKNHSELPTAESTSVSQPSDHPPPQDLLSEQLVLGSMMLSKDAISEVSQSLRSQDFYKPINALVFDAILNLYSQGEPTDARAVAAELERTGLLTEIGGFPYLQTLFSKVPGAMEVSHYIQSVAAKATLRRLVEASTRIFQLGYSDGEITEIVDRAQAEIYLAAERRDMEGLFDLDQLLQTTVEEVDSIAAAGGRASGVPTGFSVLDELTNGLQPGQLVVIASRSGIGKSTLALDIARNAAVKHGLAAAIFSLEMSKAEITKRILAAETGIQLRRIRSGLMNEGDWRKIVQRMTEISDAPLFIDDSPNMTITEIRAKSRRLRLKNNLRLIVVDYLQLMVSAERLDRQQEMINYSRQLKQLAKELQAPVIVLSQLSRDEQGSDRGPVLSDLPDSGSLEQDADVVILVHRPDAAAVDDPRAGEADLIVAKHRNGPSMTVLVAHQLHYARFTDIMASS